MGIAGALLFTLETSILYAGGIVMTIETKKERAARKATKPDKAALFNPDAPHEPNEVTQRAIAECRSGKGTPITREGLQKMWDEA